ncbi:MAG: hypothetical protein IPG71_08800 [bacterium]|nr:hypothetical protein [bacterium]
MAKRSKSAVHDLFVAIRRVVVLLIAAFGLAMEWPLPELVTRVAVLWAVLVVVSQAGEVLFQYLTHRAIMQQPMIATDEPQGASRS